MEKHQHMKRDSLQDENGFTLIELIVVVLIIAILTAIAMSVYMRQREKAWEAAVISDLYNAAIAQSSYNGEFAVYSDHLPDLWARGFNSTSGVNVTIESDLGEDYCMEGFHNADPATVFHVKSGEGEPNPSPGTCV